LPDAMLSIEARVIAALERIATATEMQALTSASSGTGPITAGPISLGAEVETAARAVVSDDGREIRLTLYTEARAVAASVVLEPVRAMALAQRLIAPAVPRLSSRKPA
jgi:hypothetical protein